MLDSTDPDLSRFARRGGKMIVTIGTDDTLASPGAQLDYYQSVLDKMGRRAVDGFARFFVIPQANHGLMARTADVDGAGKAMERIALPTQYERFALLVDWVERRIAPGMTVTLSGGDRTLPLCSYPHTRNTPAGMLLSRRPTAARTADSRGTSAGMRWPEGTKSTDLTRRHEVSKTTRREYQLEDLGCLHAGRLGRRRGWSETAVTSTTRNDVGVCDRCLVPPSPRIARCKQPNH